MSDRFGVGVIPRGFILLNPDDAKIVIGALLDASCLAEEEGREHTKRRYDNLIDHWPTGAIVADGYIEYGQNEEVKADGSVDCDITVVNELQPSVAQDEP